MMRRARIVLTGVVLALLVPPLSGDSGPGKIAPGSEPKLKELMRKKLQYAQKVLEGVAINNFNMIMDNADGLMQISKETEWQVLKTPRYEVQSNDFRRALESLQEKASQKNTDGVALGYVELTLSCVRCHKYVREARMTRLDLK
jgi:cytochrome c556